MTIRKPGKKTGKTPKGAAGNTESLTKQMDDVIESLLSGAKANPIASGVGKVGRQAISQALKAYQKKQDTPKLMPEQNLPERNVPKGEKPNMLDVAGGAKTVNVAKGGLMSKKKSAKKSKKSSRLAKRGYGIAKRG